MSGPLDRIEANARRTQAGEQPHDAVIWKLWALDRSQDVLALVNVAKAAEGVMSQMDYETPHHTRLREALAALNKEPA